MDPVSVVLQALVAGAAAVVKPTAEKVVTDAYGALKSLVERRFNVSLSTLERRPDDKVRQGIISEDLAANNAAGDREVLECSKRVIEAVRSHDPAVEQVIGVRLEDVVTAAAVAIRRVSSTASGVSVRRAQIGGELIIEDVGAGAEKKTPPQK